MKYTRPRAAIATGLCLLMAAGPVAPAAFAVDADSAGQQPYAEPADPADPAEAAEAAEVITVLFDAYGGAFSSGATFLDIATQADGTVVFPENPTREGYYFAGWTYDSAGTKPFVEGTKLDRHTNLYAQWNKQDVPVQEDVTYTFKDVDGTVLGSVTYTYEQVLAGVYACTTGLSLLPKSLATSSRAGASRAPTT